MGGFGSGKTSNRCTVEACIALDVNKLTRDKSLRPDAHKAGTLVWTNTDTGEELSSIGWAAQTTMVAGWIRPHYTRTRDNDNVDLRAAVFDVEWPYTRDEKRS